MYITLFSKLINVTKVREWECSNQYKVNTYHYINYQEYVCTWQIHAHRLPPGLSLLIILTLLSMCGTKIILVPHIDWLIDV